jgi:hypothetical protein
MTHAERVQVLARAHAHLLVGQAGEGALRRRHLVAADGGRVHRGVLVQEQVTNVHGCPLSCAPPAVAGLGSPPAEARLSNENQATSRWRAAL